MLTTSKLSIRPIEGAESQIRSLLLRSYIGERTFMSLFDSGRTGYEQRIRSFIREYDLYHRKHEQAVIGAFFGDQLVGAALFCEPQYAEALAVSKRARLGLIATVGWACAKAYLRYQDALRQALPDGRWCYLPLVAVDPAFRGQGVGQAVFDWIWNETRSYPDALGIALGSGAAGASGYYDRLGFQSVGHVEVDGIKETIFFRPTQ